MGPMHRVQVDGGEGGRGGYHSSGLALCLRFYTRGKVGKVGKVRTFRRYFLNIQILLFISRDLKFPCNFYFCLATNGISLIFCCFV